MKKNILHIYKRAIPHSKGGVEHTLHLLACSQAESFDTHVISTTSENTTKLNIDGVKISFFSELAQIASTPISLKFLISGIREVRKADVAYLHYPYPLADLICLFMPKSKKLFLYYHSDIVSKPKLLQRVYRPIEKIILRRANVAIFSSQNTLDSSNNRHFLKSKVTIIPAGVTDLRDQPRLRPNIDFNFDEDFMIFVGVFRHYKGLKTLVHAAKETGIRILLVGSGGNQSEIKALCEAKRIKNVFFAGQLSESEKAFCISKANALILPSDLRSEALGLSLIEGLAMGKALISCDIGTGTSFVNKNNVTGLTIEPNSSEALTEAMLKIANDTPLRRQFEKNSRKRYEKLFTATSMVEAHKHLLREHLSEI